MSALVYPESNSELHLVCAGVLWSLTVSLVSERYLPYQMLYSWSPSLYATLSASDCSSCFLAGRDRILASFSSVRLEIFSRIAAGIYASIVASGFLGRSSWNAWSSSSCYGYWVFLLVSSLFSDGFAFFYPSISCAPSIWLLAPSFYAVAACSYEYIS